MDSAFHQVINMPDRTYQSLARVQLKELAMQAGFQGHRLGEIEIIIGEITSNISKHTSNGGTIFCKIGNEPASPFIEFIVIDNGPGINSIKKMLQDGISSKKTLGHGLGAIQRLSTLFDIYSLPGWGTILFSRNYKAVKKPATQLEFEVLRTAKTGESSCGDNWFFQLKGRMHQMAVIDGLGHGPEAASAANIAVQTLQRSEKTNVDQQLREIHDALKRTRGVVMTLLNIDTVNRQLYYCGVGNIATKIISKNLTSKGKTINPYNGILGHTMPGSTTGNFTHFDPKMDAVICHSDGISTRWDLLKYPNIMQHHSMTICAALYKDFNRGNDDATIGILK